MKKKILFIISALITISNSIYADNVNYYRDLGSFGFITRIEVENATVSGDIIYMKKGEEANFKIDFSAPFTCASLKVSCHLVINNVTTLLPFYYEPATCVTLPLLRGNYYTFIAPIQIPYNVPFSACILRIEVLSKEDGKMIIGFDVPIKII